MPLLHAGDVVALVAPAAHQAGSGLDLIAQACQQLTDWGLVVQVLCEPERRHFYLAGDDAHRAQQLQTALTDPDIRGVFVTRGGYGSTRVLPLLAGRPVADRVICGYSDISSLLFNLPQIYPGVSAVHGPGLAGAHFLADTDTAATNRHRLQALLFSDCAAYGQAVDVIRPGQAQGPLVGGNLSVLVSLLGTPFAPDFTGQVLFLEDVGEKPYVIDRMLTQLRLAGKLNGLRGLVFGDMEACHDGHHDVREVIADALGPTPYPVVYGFRAGHGALNTAFRFGQVAMIASADATLTLADE
ncbi:MAG TPA: LD-carboxypeptidase [Gammaproteobacteria bacterium]|jgi:muramoyltetrapeptide carboxypeptidase|nr:LD-carboxypeptidase [Gammaproteobacteria bacterium]